MMSLSGQPAGTEDKGVQVLALPYQGACLRNGAGAPKKSGSLKKLGKPSRARVSMAWLHALRARSTELTLPRFKTDGSRMSLVTCSPWASPVKQTQGRISAILHGCKVEVDERYVAAAATVIVATRSVSPRPFVFRAGPSFLFLFARADGAILFMAGLRPQKLIHTCILNT